MDYLYKVGDKLFMKPCSEAGSDTYKARIVDLNEQYIYIELPMHEQSSRLAFFPEGTELEVWFTGKDKVPYQFVSQVAGRRKERIPVTLLTHPHPDTIERKQRRQYLRVPCDEKIFLYVQNDHQAPKDPLIAQAVDLSGGGMAFTLAGKEQLQPGDEVKWEFSLPPVHESSTPISGRGVVKRVTPPAEKGMPYKYSVAFTEIREQDRQQIIRYCLRRQLEMRKKGLDMS
ncbi:hypothetical protein GCM10010965_09790 [Caldalkalibacillus thermarum]|uniref:flagellar brake protein n=1 Tax=Caldalkalibacillus thermarum TaxID=296745 RepID=UPI001665DB2C|nr:flagellar brake domain-containing protein [Caldalkalibacillus thermarum]GGK18841.1 hypothetical protein GCM10010965_09790 [Caldalkalibacillus thermarum]